MECLEKHRLQGTLRIEVTYEKRKVTTKQIKMHQILSVWNY